MNSSKNSKSEDIRRTIDWLPELGYALMYIPRLTIKLIRGAF